MKWSPPMHIRLLNGLLALTIGLPVGMTWHLVQQKRQDQRNAGLVNAVRRADVQAVLTLLEQGANPNEYGNADADYYPVAESATHETVVSLWEDFQRRLRGQHQRAQEIPLALPQFPKLPVLLLALGLECQTSKDDCYCPSLVNPIIVRALIDKGANLNVRGRFGESPLSVAIFVGERQTVQLLLDKGVQVNVTDDKGETPLHYARCRCDIKTTTQLLERGANINARYADGSTVVMPSEYLTWKWGEETAHDHEVLKLMRVLLAWHPNLDLTDKQGNTALSIARKSKLTMIAAMLRASGATK
jgi:ankyrin repeat protein